MVSLIVFAALLLAMYLGFAVGVHVTATDLLKPGDEYRRGGVHVQIKRRGGE